MKKNIYIIMIIIASIVILYLNNIKESQHEEEFINVQLEEKEITEEKEENIKVHIVGAIKNPGVIETTKSSRIIDVIEKAGGVLEYADINKVNLAYKIEDGDKIYIPSIIDDEESKILEQEAGANIIENINNGKININKATRCRIRNTSWNWCFNSFKDHKI